MAQVITTSESHVTWVVQGDVRGEAGWKHANSRVHGRKRKTTSCQRVLFDVQTEASMQVNTRKPSYTTLHEALVLISETYAIR
jgi:hypothetical protein